MQILSFGLSGLFLSRAADYPDVQRIMFLPLKQAKPGQSAETVLTNLLTIFAQVRAALSTYASVGSLSGL